MFDKKSRDQGFGNGLCWVIITGHVMGTGGMFVNVF